MLYPAIMVVVGIAIVGILFVVVIPKVTKIFEDMNVALPWTTRILIAVSSSRATTGTWCWPSCRRRCSASAAG